MPCETGIPLSGNPRYPVPETAFHKNCPNCCYKRMPEIFEKYSQIPRPSFHIWVFPLTGRKILCSNNYHTVKLKFFIFASGF